MEITRLTQTELPLLGTVEDRHLSGETVVVRLSRTGFALEFRPARQAEWRQLPALPGQMPSPELLAQGEEAAAFLAWSEGGLVGQIAVCRHLHRLARICDLRVNTALRRQGIGTELVATAERWAWKQGMVGICFETQDTNPGACQFIMRCGYRLGGVDQLRYAGLPSHIGKIDALFDAALVFYKLFT